MEGEDSDETRAGEGRRDVREEAESAARGEERAGQRWEGKGARTNARTRSNEEDVQQHARTRPMQTGRERKAEREECSEWRGSRREGKDEAERRARAARRAREREKRKRTQRERRWMVEGAR